MTFDLTPTAAQQDLARRTHEFAESVVRPVALDYDQRQEFPWPVLEEAAQRGFYSPLFYRDLIGDPTGLSLPMFMEELFWGCARIGLAIVMPALALSAIGQAASPEQMLEWAPECSGVGAGVFRNPGRPQARGAGDLGAGGWQRRTESADPRAARRRRLGDRRSQDVDRQRRYRRRACGQRGRRRRARSPRPGVLHRPGRHTRPSSIWKPAPG